MTLENIDCRMDKDRKLLMLTLKVKESRLEKLNNCKKSAEFCF